MENAIEQVVYRDASGQGAPVFQPRMCLKIGRLALSGQLAQLQVPSSFAVIRQRNQLFARQAKQRCAQHLRQRQVVMGRYQDVQQGASRSAVS
jgi:hypothetical protein